MDKISVEEVYKLIGKLYVDFYIQETKYTSQLKMMQEKLKEEVEKRLVLEKEYDKSRQREAS